MWKKFNKTDRRILTAALTLLLMMLYLLYDDSLIAPKDDTTNLKALGTVSKVTQDVRRKYSKQFSWKSARSPDVIYEGDSLFTGKDSTAVIEFNDGRKLVLQPNSLIVLTTKENQLSLDLRFGRIAGNIEGCVNLNVKGSQKQVCGEKNAKVEIDAEGSVKSAEKPVVQNGIDWQVLPPRPFFHTDRDTPLKLQWTTRGFFSRFRIQFSKTPSFEKIEFEEKSKQNSLETTRYPKEGLFHVRIEGDDIEGELSASSPATTIEFKPTPLLSIQQPQDLQKIALRTDADGELIDKNQIDIRWDYPLAGTQFQLQLAKDENFAQIVQEQNNLKSHQFTISRLQPGSYYLRVRDAAVLNGVRRPWSPVVQFQLEVLPPARLLAPELLTRQIDHAEPSTDPVVLKWDEVDRAHEYVVETATKADFSDKKTVKTQETQLTLSELTPGKTFFRVAAATAKGSLGDNSAVGSLKVSLKRPELSPLKNIDIMGETPEDPGKPQEVPASWTDLKLAASYRVQISEDSQFEDATEIKSSQPSTQLTLPKPGLFYWRVQGLDSDGKAISEYSTPGKVNYNLRVPLALPNLQEPRDKMTLFFQQNIAPYIWFEWLPVRQAVLYRFEISQDPNFQSKIFSVSTKDSKVLVKKKLPEGVLYWRVQAEGDDKRVSHWSPTRALNILSGRSPAGQARPGGTNP